jgi:hypothetical protein
LCNHQSNLKLTAQKVWHFCILLSLLILWILLPYPGIILSTLNSASLFSQTAITSWIAEVSPLVSVCWTIHCSLTSHSNKHAENSRPRSGREESNNPDTEASVLGDLVARLSYNSFSSLIFLLHNCLYFLTLVADRHLGQASSAEVSLFGKRNWI